MTTNQPNLVYWKNAKPSDFMDAQIGDWIQYVGNISTDYELRFIRNFGGFWSSHIRSHSTTTSEMAMDIKKMLNLLDSVNCDNGCPLESELCDITCQKAINIVAEHDEQIRRDEAAKERERVLDALCSDDCITLNASGSIYRIHYTSLEKKLRSLRGEQPEDTP